MLDLKDKVVEYCRQSLRLLIPIRKTVHLAADPVPFLGYVLDESSYRVLGRTKRRHQGAIRRGVAAGVRESELARKRTSFEAFANLDGILPIVTRPAKNKDGG